MYKFVRFKSKIDGKDNSKWWFATENSEQVLEHTEKFFKPIMQNGFNNVASDCIQKTFKHGSPALMNHPTDDAAAHILEITGIKYKISPLALFEVANNLLMTVVNNRQIEVNKGRAIYLEDGVRQFGYDNRYYEIAEVIEKDELVYPDFVKPTIDDVRYIRWPNGKHWYVTINKEDVVDSRGNQKWNSKEEAERAAIAAMQGFTAHSGYINVEYLAMNSLLQADALIEQLKKQ